MPAEPAGSPSLLGQNIVVVDDCRLSRENLGTVLARSGAVPYLAWDLTSLVSVLGGLDAPIVLLDTATRDFEMLLRVVTQINSAARPIVLDASEDDEGQLLACAGAGVTAIHLRSESLGTLLNLVAKVASGGTHVSSRVSGILLRRVALAGRGPRPAPQGLDLTDREAQILRLIQRGLTNREIAGELAITVNTVKNHVHQVLSKLGVANRSEAAARYTSGRAAGPSPRD